MDNCICNVCHYDKVDCCNAFLIPQTPYPQNRSYNEIGCTNLGICLWSPWRLMEAIGMMGYGVITFAIPCFTFKLDSYHHGNDINIECCHPGCTWIPSPFHYKYLKDSANLTEGYQIGKSLGNYRPQGPGESFHMTSHTPGGRCLVGGFEKVSMVLCDIICCPVSMAIWTHHCCC